MQSNNIFNLKDFKEFEAPELFEILLQQKNLKIERIVSKPFTNLNAEWYDQDTDEWVLLLSGNARIEFENEIKSLNSGDYIFIKAHQRHRVIETGEEGCVWLAVHIG